MFLLLSPQKFVSVDIDIMVSGWTISSVRMARSTGYSGDERYKMIGPHHLPRTHSPSPSLPAAIPPSFQPYSHSPQVSKALTHCFIQKLLVSDVA